MKTRTLDKFEKVVYEVAMKDLIKKKVDCWNWKAPCTFMKIPDDFYDM